MLKGTICNLSRFCFFIFLLPLGKQIISHKAWFIHTKLGGGVINELGATIKEDTAHEKILIIIDCYIFN